MGFVGPVVAVAPLAQTTEGGRGGRRAINDRIEGRGVTFIMIGRNVALVSFQIKRFGFRLYSMEMVLQ